MMRRGLLAVVVVFGSMPGCGLIKTSQMAHQAHQAGTVTKTFNAPVHRVLVAAMEATGPEWFFMGLASFHFPAGTFQGEFANPFESVHSAPSVLRPLRHGSDFSSVSVYDIEHTKIGSGGMIGETNDGRPVTLWLLERDRGKTTEVSMLIAGNRPGDARLIHAYLDRVVNRLVHPTPPTLLDEGGNWRKVIVNKAGEPSPSTEAATANQGGPDR